MAIPVDALRAQLSNDIGALASAKFQNDNSNKVSELETKISNIKALIQLQEELDTKHDLLKTLYDDGLEKNKVAIAGIASTIQELAKTAFSLLQQIPIEGHHYHEQLGTFLSRENYDETEKVLKDCPRDYDPDRPRKVSGEAHQNYEQWKQKWGTEYEGQKQNLSGTTWYNTTQVANLTGQGEVPAGTKQLSQFLKYKKTQTPLAFSYLKTPKPNDSSYNHFVSFHISPGGKEITYIDSNGELMSPEDKEKIKKQFPGARIAYLSHEAPHQKIYDDELTTKELREQSQHSILRVQFDGHNCGMYSTEFVTMLNSARRQAGQNPALYEELVAQGINEIKKMHYTADQQRNTHERCLNSGNTYKFQQNLSQQQNKGIKSRL